MGRYNRINLDGKSITETALVEEATLPGSVVVYNSTTTKYDKFATAGGGSGIQLYVTHTDNLVGETSDTAVAADTTGVFEYIEKGRELAVLVDATSVLVKDSPLTPGAIAGQLKIGTPATDHIVAFSQETYTVGASAELVRVRGA